MHDSLFNEPYGFMSAVCQSSLCSMLYQATEGYLHRNSHVRCIVHDPPDATPETMSMTMCRECEQPTTHMEVYDISHNTTHRRR
jgi:hypothetical protein